MKVFKYEVWILKRIVRIRRGVVIANTDFEAESLIRELWQCKPNQIVIITNTRGIQDVVA